MLQDLYSSPRRAVRSPAPDAGPRCTWFAASGEPRNNHLKFTASTGHESTQQNLSCVLVHGVLSCFDWHRPFTAACWHSLIPISICSPSGSTKRVSFFNDQLTKSFSEGLHVNESHLWLWWRRHPSIRSFLTTCSDTGWLLVSHARRQRSTRGGQ